MKAMNKFWQDIMNELLDVLYHGEKPEEIDWIHEYRYECENMIEDIEEFYEALEEAGHCTSNEVMANFLIYTEFMHINNSQLVTEDIVDMDRLIAISSRINDELAR